MKTAVSSSEPKAVQVAHSVEPFGFTRGPWHVNSETYAGGDAGANTVIHSYQGIVAMACTIHEGRENAEANARLIAAAPELLAALSMIVQKAATAPGMMSQVALNACGKIAAKAIAKMEERA